MTPMTSIRRRCRKRRLATTLTSLQRRDVLTQSRINVVVKTSRRRRRRSHDVYVVMVQMTSFRRFVVVDA